MRALPSAYIKSEPIMASCKNTAVFDVDVNISNQSLKSYISIHSTGGLCIYLQIPNVKKLGSEIPYTSFKPQKIQVLYNELHHMG
jgi:hypothetical protein